jgi:uncharacterized membrane protein YkvA (DUF1232 family)
MRFFAAARTDAHGRQSKDDSFCSRSGRMKKLLFILGRTSRSDLRLAWLALRHPHRPAWLAPALSLLAIYAIDPFNFAMPLLGVVDDLVIVPLLLHFLLKLLPAHLRSDNELRARRVVP